MKKFKRAASALLVFSLVASICCGCSGAGARQYPTVIIVDAPPPSQAEPTTDENGIQSSDVQSPDVSAPAEPVKKAPEYVDWMLEEKVHEIRIEIEPGEWKSMCRNAYVGDYHQANVTIDGELVENVGVRTRGHATLYAAVELFPASQRYPLKIKFDKYVKKQTFLGLDELALNNGFDDPSFMRDYLGYGAFRALGGDASCVTFFNVYVNDQLRGFYVGVESIDSSYLERIFDSHKNNLYEGEEAAYLTKNMSMSRITQKKGSDESKSDIKQLVKALDEMPLGEKGEIEDILDVDSALRVFAVNAVMDNRDGYEGVFSHNYYFYNNNGKLVMLPWDMNAPSLTPGSDIASGVYNVNGYSDIRNRPLLRKLLAVEEYYAAYLDYCSQLCEWLPEACENVLRVYDIVKESVENDKNKFYSNSEYNYCFSEKNYFGVVYFLKKRYDYLNKRLPQLIGKPISESALNPPLPPPPESSSSEESSEPTVVEPDPEQSEPTLKPFEPAKPPVQEFKPFEPEESSSSSSARPLTPTEVPAEPQETAPLAPAS